MTAADDNVARYRNEHFENAAFQEPRHKLVDDLGRIVEVKIKKDSPNDPQTAEENKRIRKRASSESIPFHRHTNSAYHGEGQDGGEEGGKRAA